MNEEIEGIKSYGKTILKIRETLFKDLNYYL